MRFATVVIVASPWLLIFAGFAVVSGTIPWWSVIGLSVIVVASALLVGISGRLAEPEPWSCPDEVDES